MLVMLVSKNLINLNLGDCHISSDWAFCVLNIYRHSQTTAPAEFDEFPQQYGFLSVELSSLEDNYVPELSCSIAPYPSHLKWLQPFTAQHLQLPGGRLKPTVNPNSLVTQQGGSSPIPNNTPPQMPLSPMGNHQRMPSNEALAGPNHQRKYNRRYINRVIKMGPLHQKNSSTEHELFG